MILQTTVEFLRDKIFGMRLFERVHELVEIIEDTDGKRSPVEYVSKGTYRRIKISAVNGVAYFRKNGDMTSSNSDAQSLVACTSLLNVNIPLKIVMFKLKSELPIDNQYSDDWLAEQIIPVITTKSGQLRKKLNAQSVSINYSSHSTDSFSIWNEETNMSENGDVNSKFACVSMNVNVSILIERNCFNTLCACYDREKYPSPICPPTSTQIPRLIIDFVGFYTVENQSVYTVSALNGKTIRFIMFGEVNLQPSQYSLTGDQLTITFNDPDYVIAGNVYVNICFS